MKTITIFGDKYKIKKTYDIDHFGIGRYGSDVYCERNSFLCHFDGYNYNINKLKQYIKINLYRTYESTYPYYK
jgi:hypothetical protein